MRFAKSSWCLEVDAADKSVERSLLYESTMPVSLKEDALLLVKGLEEWASHLLRDVSAKTATDEPL